MGSPPDGKGGKKGAPPAPKSGDSQGKAKGKGSGPAPIAGLWNGGTVKIDAWLIWFQSARKMHEDGYWDADVFTGAMPVGHLPILPAEEREAFEKDCPFLSTMVMLSLGQRFMAKFSGTTKQVREVKLGDGRGVADEVEMKTVELTAEENAKREEEVKGFLERLELSVDWKDRVETYLSNHPLAVKRAAFEEKVQVLLARTKMDDDAPKDREAARPRANTEERDKREAARKEKEAAMRKKEQDALAEKFARMKHLQSLAPADINTVEWSKAKAMHFMGGGSGGVMLVDLGQTCVVLKLQGKTAANEMLAEHVANAVGTRVARVRVVRRGDTELQQILESSLKCQIFGIDPTIALGQFFGIWTKPTESGEVKVTKLSYEEELKIKGLCEGSQIGSFGILEYAPGHPLMGMDGNEVMRDPPPHLLREVGCVCALDVLINNLDRIPLPVWQNEGNLGNVMVVNGGKSIMGIDQQVNLVMAGPGLDTYIVKVRKLVEDSKPGGDPKGIVAKLQQAMMENCGAELSEENALRIVGGLHEGFWRISAAFTNGKIKEGLDIGAKMCYERLIIDGTCAQACKPNLDTVDAMNEFVCSIASQIADQLRVLN